MAVLLSVCTGQIIAVLDAGVASPRVYGTAGDPMITASEITNAILNADAYICNLIRETPNHPVLSSFRTTATVAHGGLLPARIGPILGIVVDSKIPTLYPPNEIEHERTNARSLTLIEKHYAITLTPMGERLSHNGSADATVDLIPAFTLTGSPQAPDSYTAAVIAGALAEIRQKQGAFTDAAGYWQRRWEHFIAMIRQGAVQLQEAT